MDNWSEEGRILLETGRKYSQWSTFMAWCSANADRLVCAAALADKVASAPVSPSGLVDFHESEPEMEAYKTVINGKV